VRKFLSKPFRTNPAGKRRKERKERKERKKERRGGRKREEDRGATGIRKPIN
jgi:hypothetical protein